MAEEKKNKRQNLIDIFMLIIKVVIIVLIINLIINLIFKNKSNPIQIPRRYMNLPPQIVNMDYVIDYYSN